MDKQFWPETINEWNLRMDLPTFEQRMDYYSIVKDMAYPPGDPRRYGVTPNDASVKP
jgi:hypothetical protein